MQTAYSFFELERKPKSIPRKEGLRITARDLEILKFVLEMKFSIIPDIQMKFFCCGQNGQSSKSLIWTKQRIQKLVAVDFLKFEHQASIKNPIVATPKGYFFLKNSLSKSELCRPLFSIDNRTFEHDLQVSKLRIQMECTEKASDWISERQLCDNSEYSNYFSNEYRPDGIYTSETGQKVAFELEIARKSKSRYQQKIRRYIDLLLNQNMKSKPFDLVHYVCDKPEVLNILESDSQLFRPFFKFELLSKFQTERNQ